MTYNSDNFDLSNWELTLPVDSKGGTSGDADVVPYLDNYQSKYFYSGSDGAMILIANVAGATTPNTQYARDELREMDGNDVAGWKLSEGGTMTATLKVDSAPRLSDGTPGREVIGQIHGANNELVRMYWDNNTVYFHNDRAGSHNQEIQYNLVDAAGNTPVIHLGDEFSYKIDEHNNTLTVDVYVNGDDYNSTTTVNSVWQTDTLYFKAGVYLGENDSQHATGNGEVSFYGLDFSHTAGDGLGGLKEILGTKGNDSLNTDGVYGGLVNGLAGNDTLYGHNGNDSLYGSTGNDKLYGSRGDDLLCGGAGDDIMNGGSGNDILTGNSGHDTMTGGTGNDTFKYYAATDGGDTITDFHNIVGDTDTLNLAGLFEANGLGTMDTATAIKDHILLVTQQSDGVHVDFDKDGTGSGAAVHLVTLAGDHLSSLDILHQIKTAAG
jgi:Ca2+-binding RTX toxin-like protein